MSFNLFILDRLRDTLLHELCHACAWIKSGMRDGHGPFWKGWSQKAMKAFPDLPVIERCHTYAIRTKYTYVCKKCGLRVGRHSKSIKVETQLCKMCGGMFELLLQGNGSTKTKITPNLQVQMLLCSSYWGNSHLPFF